MKNKADNNGTVYSTNPDFQFEYDGTEAATLEPAKQNLRVMLDKKQRAGKKVTLITGFQGSDYDLALLGKEFFYFYGALTADVRTGIDIDETAVPVSATYLSGKVTQKQKSAKYDTKIHPNTEDHRP